MPWSLQKNTSRVTLILMFLLGLTLLLPGPVHAAVCTPENFSGKFEDAKSLGQLISALYSYSQSILGLCIFGMFLYAGLQLMLPGGKKEVAIKILQDAVIGAILLFSAYVILNTVNSDLVCQKDVYTQTP